MVGLLRRHGLEELHDLDLNAGTGDMGLVDSIEELAADADFELRALPSPGWKDVADVRRLLGLSSSGQEAHEKNGDDWLHYCHRSWIVYVCDPPIIVTTFAARCTMTANKFRTSRPSTLMSRISKAHRSLQPFPWGCTV